VESQALLRLIHLVSPSLPVGAFSYSQGIEWAVETGWIRTAKDLDAWLSDQLRNALAPLDLPLLIRMHRAAANGDREAMERWVEWLIAARETAELRSEEASRGRALAELLVSWDAPRALAWKPLLARAQAAGFALAAVSWGVSARETALGYAWAWLENLVLAGVKIVPLGQTQGQQLLERLVPRIPDTVAGALAREDADIGASCPALAIASAAHETQYTRLFRS
jgi:urease accessory protein